MIPYGLPLIYFTLPVMPSLQPMRLFLLPLSPPSSGAIQRKEANIMTTKTLSKSDLAQLIGSENWFRHGVERQWLCTGNQLG